MIIYAFEDVVLICATASHDEIYLFISHSAEQEPRHLHHAAAPFIGGTQARP